jgi:DivIVA domain-containing protein
VLALEVIVAVAVLAGVAVVASTRWPVFDDEPEDVRDLGLPRDRPLRSGDVPGLRFRIGLRGYRMSDVDQVLDRLRGALEDAEARSERPPNPPADPQATQREPEPLPPLPEPLPPMPEPLPPSPLPPPLPEPLPPPPEPPATQPPPSIGSPPSPAP